MAAQRDIKPECKSKFVKKNSSFDLLKVPPFFFCYKNETDSFSEKGTEVLFDLVISDLKVQRKLTSGFAKKPKNGQTISRIVTEQGINFAIEMAQPQKVYRFEIKRLPTAINPEKAKFKVNFALI